MDILLGFTIGTIALMISTTCYYLILHKAWEAFPKFKRKPMQIINIFTLSMFIGHMTCILLYTLIYYAYVTMGHSALSGQFNSTFTDYLYFSLTNYSSLGYGDIYAEGPVRIIAGIEAINGLGLIGWSVAFTYFFLEHFWELREIPSGKTKI